MFHIYPFCISLIGTIIFVGFWKKKKSIYHILYDKNWVLEIMIVSSSNILYAPNGYPFI